MGAVDGILLHAGKTQFAGGEGTVIFKVGDTEAGSGTEGVLIDQLLQTGQQKKEVLQGLGKGGQPDADGGGHGPLQMGVAGHGLRGMAPGRGTKSLRQGTEALPQAAEALFHKQAQHHQRLIVTAASRVDFLAGLAVLFGEKLLYGRVAVFLFRADAKTALFPKFTYLPQAGLQGAPLIIG